MFFIKRLWVISLLIVPLFEAYALPEGVGDFDLDKVNRAAFLSYDSGKVQGDTLKPVAKAEENTASVIIRVMVYLVIVIVLIFLVAWFIRRSGLNAVRGGGGAMDVIETLQLGQNRMIIMVRVMDEIYLMSQCSSNISLLEKIGGQRALDIIASSKGGGSIVKFKDAFNNFMGKIKKAQ